MINLVNTIQVLSVNKFDTIQKSKPEFTLISASTHTESTRCVKLVGMFVY